MAEQLTPEKNLCCPFCNGHVDAEGWLNSNGERGPECETCGATAPSLHRWNTRVTEREGWRYARQVEERVRQLLRCEFICKNCGIRKDGEVDGQPSF